MKTTNKVKTRVWFTFTFCQVLMMEFVLIRTLMKVLQNITIVVHKCSTCNYQNLATFFMHQAFFLTRKKSIWHTKPNYVVSFLMLLYFTIDCPTFFYFFQKCKIIELIYVISVCARMRLFFRPVITATNNMEILPMKKFRNIGIKEF